MLVSVALVVSGCGRSGGTAAHTGSASSAAAADARAALVKSASALAKTPYKFAVTSSGATGSGATDPAAGRVQATMRRTQAGTTYPVALVVIGTNMWAKVDLGAQANKALGIPTGKYMHIDSTKVGNKAALGLNVAAGSDPAGTVALLQGAAAAQRIDDTHYRATLDLTRAADSILAQDTVNKLGDKAKAVPATMTLDGQGRLIELDLDLGAGDIVKVTYTGYGTPVTVNQPAKASVVEAPQQVYALFNS